MRAVRQGGLPPRGLAKSASQVPAPPPVALRRFLRAGALLVAIGCRDTTPEDAAQARAGMAERNAPADSVGGMIDAQVPSAVAGDSGWRYAQRVTADLDGDGSDETAVLISDVALDARGMPIWEHGHRWQLYVQESGDARDGGEVTRLYARFVPSGKVTAELGLPASGSRVFIVLLEQSPDRMGVSEYEYHGPGRADVRKRVDRALDPVNQFRGSPRP